MENMGKLEVFDVLPNFEDARFMTETETLMQLRLALMQFIGYIKAKEISRDELVSMLEDIIRGKQ